MHVPSLAAALALLLAALPAGAGELIRYRAPDGSVGFVDDEKRLPPGVEVVSRTPIERAAPPPPPAAEPPPAPAQTAPSPAEPVAVEASLAAPGADEADCEALTDLLARTRCRALREERCSHFGLSPRCAPAQIASAREWCARSEALRLEIASIADERDAARERHAACMRTGPRPRRCDDEALADAERAALVAERRVDALEAQCHDEGCVPGWVREACALEPGA